MYKLRKLTQERIGYFVTGEYGEKTKRPHWHAIIFNWDPPDGKYFRSNDRGDKIYKSALLEKTWGKGHAEYGSVTFESAGYCARYAAKKLVHGKDGDHDYHPISKKSCDQAIGKAFLERYWPDVFSYGKCVLADGTETSIPRYYEKWLKQHQPQAWSDYVTRLKAERIAKALEAFLIEQQKEREINAKRKQVDPLARHQISKNDVQKIITEAKFKLLHPKGQKC